MNEPIYPELSDDQILQIFHECLAAEQFRNSLIYLGRCWNPTARLRHSLQKIVNPLESAP